MGGWIDRMIRRRAVTMDNGKKGGLSGAEKRDDNEGVKGNKNCD